MDKKIKGSWLIHHTNKLQSVTNQSNYEHAFLSGKAGMLLSAISSDEDTTVSSERVEVLAKAANINTVFELPRLLEVLRDRELIDTSKSGVAVLGVTTSSALLHTSDIFDSLEPTAKEEAIIELAENASLKPISIIEASEGLSNQQGLEESEIEQVLYDAEQIGFVDFEKLDNGEILLFNGNLFRRETTFKIKKVMDSLSVAEQIKLTELTETLERVLKLA